MTEEELEIRMQISVYAGSASALESFAAKLRSRAGEIFAAGRSDSIAEYLRKMAVECDESAVVSRLDQERADEALAELIASHPEAPDA